MGTTGEVEGYWYCNVNADDMCYFWKYDTESRSTALNNPDHRTNCWGVPPKLPCVYGTESYAVMQCGNDCEQDKKVSKDGLLSNQSYIEELPGETHDTWECTNFAATVEVVPTEEIANCEGAGILPDFSDPSSIFKSFVATLMLTGPDGGSTSQSNIRGYLALKTENCDTEKCDLVIGGLEGRVQDLSGVYITRTGTLPYQFEDVDFRLFKELRGQWYFARGSVSFPLDTAKARGWTNGMEIDQLTLPGTSAAIVIEQIAGTYRSGVLSLSFTYSHSGSVSTLTLETY